MSDIKDYINKIICGDCLDIMRDMPSESVDCVVTSPPYNLKGQNAGYKHGKLNKLYVEGYENYVESMSDADYIKWQRDCMTEMWRLLKPNGAIFYNHKIHPGKDGMRHLSQPIIEGFNTRQLIIWNKMGAVNHRFCYFADFFEIIWLIAKPECEFDMKLASKGNIWNFRPEQNREHPASFPVALPMKAIASMKQCEVVLDPFSGSGTTAIATIRNYKQYIGIDLSEVYCKMARGRIKDELAQTNFGF